MVCGEVRLYHLQPLSSRIGRETLIKSLLAGKRGFLGCLGETGELASEFLYKKEAEILQTSNFTLNKTPLFIRGLTWDAVCGGLEGVCGTLDAVSG